MSPLQHLDLDMAAAIAWETLDGDQNVEEVASRLIQEGVNQTYVAIFPWAAICTNASCPALDDVLDGQQRRVDLVGIALKGSALCVTAHERFLLHGPISCVRIVICQAKGV
jgi:hypothetical protein